jgi:hypothetical protein
MRQTGAALSQNAFRTGWSAGAVPHLQPAVQHTDPSTAPAARPKPPPAFDTQALALSRAPTLPPEAHPGLRKRLNVLPAGKAEGTATTVAAPSPPTDKAVTGSLVNQAKPSALSTDPTPGKSPGPAVNVADLVAAKEQVSALSAKLPQIRVLKPEVAKQIEALVPVFNNALLAKDVYYDASIPSLMPPGYSRLEPKDLAALNLKLSDLVDSRSGYFAAVYKTPEGRYVVANRGTATGKAGVKDWITNFKQGIGRGAAQYSHATRTAMKITQAAPGQVDFVGHSKGGGLAQTQALVANCEATVFNAAAVHRNTLKPHGAHKRPAKGLVNAYNVRGEALNFMQDRTPRFIPSVRGGRHELPAVKSPTSTPDGLQWESKMGVFSAVKNTVSLHEMNSVIHSLGWQLDKLGREAKV